MKEIEYFCNLIRGVGHNISISTENGWIYVYFDREIAFNTNANDLGVSNIVVYLSGVWKGISVQSHSSNKEIQKIINRLKQE